jgi:hypothetical protein
VGRSGSSRGPTGGGLYRAIVCAIWLAGCGYKLGPPSVTYGEPEPLRLVQPSTDTRRWYVPVTSQTLGPQVFFVDTGYGYSACDDDLIEGLGLETKGTVRVRGELGVLKAGKARLPDLQLGGHTLSGITCQVRDLGQTSSIRDPREVPVAGVIGMDVLRQFRTTIAPEDGEIHLRDSRQVAGLDDDDKTVVRLRRERFGQRAKAPLLVQDQIAWLLLDTGSTTTWVDGQRLGLEISRFQEGVAFRGTGQTQSCEGCEAPDLSGPGYQISIPDWADGLSARAFLVRRFPELSTAQLQLGFREDRVRNRSGVPLKKTSELTAPGTLTLYLAGIGPTNKAPAEIRTLYYYDLPFVALGHDRTPNTTLVDRKRGPFQPGLLGLNILALYHQELDFKRKRAQFKRVEPTALSSWGAWSRTADGTGAGVLLDRASPLAGDPTPP